MAKNRNRMMLRLITLRLDDDDFVQPGSLLCPHQQHQTVKDIEAMKIKINLMAVRMTVVYSSTANVADQSSVMSAGCTLASTACSRSQMAA